MPTVTITKEQAERKLNFIRSRREASQALGQKIRSNAVARPLGRNLIIPLERQYFRDILHVLEPMFKATREIIIPAIPSIIREFMAETRIDAYGETISKTIGEATVGIGRELKDQQIEATAAKNGIKVNNFNKTMTDKRTEALLGITIPRSEPYVESQIASFTARNVDLIKDIPRQHISKLTAIIREGTERGDSTTSIIKDIQKLTGQTRRRAKLIARDQVSKFNGKLTQLRQTESGIDEYIWSTSKDEKVRNSHARLNGKIFSWNDPPPVGHPGEDVQCRCIPIAYIPEFMDTTATINKIREPQKPRAIIPVVKKPKKKKVTKVKKPVIPEFKHELSPETKVKVKRLGDEILTLSPESDKRFDNTFDIRSTIDKDLKEILGPEEFEKYNRARVAWRADWAGSSSSSVSGLMKERVEKIGLSKKTYYHERYIDNDKKLRKEFLERNNQIKNKLLQIADTNIDSLNKALDIDYEVTQQVLREIYPSGKVKLYRGSSTSTLINNNLPIPNVGDTGEVITNSLSSWTLDKKLATHFADQRGDRGILFEAEVPIEQIYSSFINVPGFNKESEFIITNKESIKYKVVK